jgi:hypothetical protein
MNRRNFFGSLGLLVGAASLSPSIFIPKLEPVKWKQIRFHRARQVWNTGYIYCPYIPITTLPPDPTKMNPLQRLQWQRSTTTDGKTYLAGFDGCLTAAVATIILDKDGKVEFQSLPPTIIRQLGRGCKDVDVQHPAG